MSEFKHDARYAIRGMLARPAQTATIVITMVLGIGATTAVFNVVNGVLLRPSAYPDAGRLALVYEVDGRAEHVERRNPVAAANYGDWREMNRVFSDMSNFAMGPSVVPTPDGPERVTAAAVGPTFFRTIGVSPMIGRAFAESDGGEGAAPVVILGHGYWERRFGGDSGAVGRLVEGRVGKVEIVGIMPPGFRFLDQQPDIFFPWVLSAAALQNRQSHGLRVLARRQPGVTLAQAQADMDRIVATLRPTYPEYLDGWGANVVPLEDVVVGRIRPALFLLLAVVALLLLSTVFNLANLLLMRGFAEQRGLAVRAALGAGRWRLIRMRLVETCFLGAIGVLIGIPVAALATKALVGIAPAELPRADQIGLDPTVLAFAVGLTLVTSLVAGLVPALRTGRRGLESALTESGRSLIGDRMQHRWHRGFTVAQLAFSAILLVSAGLMLTTFRRLLRVEDGYDPAGVAVMKMGLNRNDYPTVEARVGLLDALLPRLEALPGVEAVGVTNRLPLLDGEGTWDVQVVGKPPPAEGERHDYGWHVVSPGYFEAMGTEVVEGRGFLPEDRMNGRPVVVVDEAFVRRFFAPGEDPVGQSLMVTTPDSTVRQIVGVVKSVRQLTRDQEPAPLYYTPYAQSPMADGPWLGSMTTVLRTAPGVAPGVALASAPETVKALDRNLLITDRTTMRSLVAGSLARERLAAVLLNVFAAIALALATVGIYGVMAFTVTERRGEIALRLALGARPAEEVWRFLRGGARLVAVGIAVGLVGAAVFTRVQASLLFGVEALDPAVYVSVAVGFAAVALATAWLSARQASRVDPMRVLREE